MVRHIVMWNFAEGLADEEKCARAEAIKRELEALPELIDGIVELSVIIDPMPTGNRDIVLNSLFESEEAFRTYVDHPEHKRVGAEFVRPYTQNRAAADFAE